MEEESLPAGPYGWFVVCRLWLVAGQATSNGGGNVLCIAVELCCQPKK